MCTTNRISVYHLHSFCNYCNYSCLNYRISIVLQYVYIITFCKNEYIHHFYSISFLHHLSRPQQITSMTNWLQCFSAYIQKHWQTETRGKLGIFVTDIWPAAISQPPKTQYRWPIRACMQKQEQPPLVRLFKTAKFFCTHCFHNRNIK